MEELQLSLRILFAILEKIFFCFIHTFIRKMFEEITAISKLEKMAEKINPNKEITR